MRRVALPVDALRVAPIGELRIDVGARRTVKGIAAVVFLRALSRPRRKARRSRIAEPNVLAGASVGSWASPFLSMRRVGLADWAANIIGDVRPRRSGSAPGQGSRCRLRRRGIGNSARSWYR